jgi:hypothetical protein
MRPYHHICALFRAPEDTLHVSLGRSTACYEYPAKSGMTYRCAPAGNRPSGVRIAGFLARWGERREQAYAEVARFLEVDPDDVRDSVEAQIAPRAEENLRLPQSRPIRRASLSEEAHDRH